MPQNSRYRQPLTAESRTRLPIAPLTVLGIETSCDETAAAVIRGHPYGTREILSNLVLSQIEEHRAYGGVVPEIAARAHIETLDRLIGAAMDQAACGWDGLDGIAVTAGPGLIGGVMVGLVTAKAIAAARGLPLLALNHLEGHALSVRLVQQVDFPYLLLLVSGGHCQLLAVRGVGQYTRLGGSLDDALGEAFDKTAKLLGLGYPGGPALEQAAKGGNAARFALPRPMLGRPGCDFSFSGLKTAVRQAIRRHGGMTEQDKADMAAAFQASVSDAVVDRTRNAMAMFTAQFGALPPSTYGEGRDGEAVNNAILAKPALVVAGGVAANQALRRVLNDLCALEGFDLFAPPIHLCTDNAAMIGWAGIERLVMGPSDPLDAPARARWPLDGGN